LSANHPPKFFNLFRIPIKWQLIISGFCIAVLVFGLSFVRPHIDFILDILLAPSIIFGCYFAYSVWVIRKNVKGRK